MNDSTAAVALNSEEIGTVLAAVGLRLDLASDGFQSLDLRLQAAVRTAARRYESVVGRPESRSDRVMWDFMGRVPGCKSALFRRLLSGREPFPVPPPTNHSYPWYDLLDSPGLRPVHLGGALPLGSMLQDHEPGERLAINQCLWRVETANDAARACLAAWGSDGGASAVGVAAAKGAEWVVTHPGAPAHRVFWGTDGVTQQGWVTDIAPSLEVGEFVVVRVIRTEDEDLAEQRAAHAARGDAVDADADSLGPIAGGFARLGELARTAPVPRGPMVEYVRWGWVIDPCAPPEARDESGRLGRAHD